MNQDLIRGRTLSGPKPKQKNFSKRRYHKNLASKIKSWDDFWCSLNDNLDQHVPLKFSLSFSLSRHDQCSNPEGDIAYQLNHLNSNYGVCNSIHS